MKKWIILAILSIPVAAFAQSVIPRILLGNGTCIKVARGEPSDVAFIVPNCTVTPTVAISSIPTTAWSDWTWIAPRGDGWVRTGGLYRSDAGIAYPDAGN